MDYDEQPPTALHDIYNTLIVCAKGEEGRWWEVGRGEGRMGEGWS
jgi:hypothetical protein